GVYLTCQAAQNGPLIAATGPNFQHLLAPAQAQGRSHRSNDVGLRDRLALANGQGRIFICPAAQFAMHKLVPRHLCHRRQHSFILDVPPANLDLNHRPPRFRQVPRQQAHHGAGLFAQFRPSHIVSREFIFEPRQPHVSPKLALTKSLPPAPAQTRTLPRDCKSAAKSARLLLDGNPPESPAPAIRVTLRRHADNQSAASPLVRSNSPAYSRATLATSRLPSTAWSCARISREWNRFPPNSKYPAPAGTRTAPEYAACHLGSETSPRARRWRRSRSRRAAGAQSIRSAPAAAWPANL